jgi:hypothetical protein
MFRGNVLVRGCVGGVVYSARYFSAAVTGGGKKRVHNMTVGQSCNCFCPQWRRNIIRNIIRRHPRITARSRYINNQI